MERRWHSLSGKEIIRKLNSRESGLSSKEAKNLLNVYGKNVLKKTKYFNAFNVFLSQFKSFLIIILIFAAVISFFMHSQIDAIVIFAIIILNAMIGFFQEYKAEKAIDELRKMMVSFAKVIRNGKIVEINSKEVVPGDILILQEGDKIVADARILKFDGLKTDESSLTGESLPSEKITGKLKENIPLAERLNMVYQGTEVVAGSAVVIVVETGINSEFGRVSELVQKIEPEKNPFKDKLDKFAEKIGIFILILSGLIVGLLFFEGVEFIQSFLVAVSLAVSAIPEGLPAVISLGLAFATKRMIKKNILIRKLPASETLGRVTFICTDKTGTLTEGRMKVSSIYVNGKIDSGENDKSKGLLFKIGVLCNNAKYGEKQGKKVLIGDPTEAALIVSAENNFLKIEKLIEQEIKIKEFAFSSNRKMMSVIRKSGKQLISYVKGAPEKIIENSDYEFVNGKAIKLDSNGRQRLIKVYEAMANKGLRVLGFAYKNNIPNDFNQEDAEKGLVFAGFQGMIDPPRVEVVNAIKLCNNAGIKVLMMTGDSKLTAEAVAKQIGLVGQSIDYKQLQKMSDDELFSRIDKISVFSRISPEDKLRVIDILKKKNEIVAMTGDGVNDALALKRADIGIAMGIRGTDVARDSSDIILIDDNFASIVEGVREGRGIYSNIKKFIKYLLSANFYEVFFVLGVMLAWRNPELLPFLPLQILWINLVTDSFPALALSLEENEKDIMERKPSQEGILNGEKGFIFFAGIVGIVLISIVFFNSIDNIDKARTMVVTTSVVYQMFLVFNCKTDKFVFKSSMNKYLIYAVGFSVFLHLIALYTPVSSLFYFVPIGINDWMQIIGAGFLGFIVMEGYKAVVLKGK